MQPNTWDDGLFKYNNLYTLTINLLWWWSRSRHQPSDGVWCKKNKNKGHQANSLTFIPTQRKHIILYTTLKTSCHQHFSPHNHTLWNCSQVPQTSLLKDTWVLKSMQRCQAEKEIPKLNSLNNNTATQADPPTPPLLLNIWAVRSCLSKCPLMSFRLTLQMEISCLQPATPPPFCCWQCATLTVHGR